MSAPERIPPRHQLTPGPIGSGCVTTDPSPLGERSAVELLTHGELVVRGQIPDASNGVLYCTVEAGGRRLPCVYKPVAGERPLWDFPDGTLAQREVAAYEISEATGWGLVPATVLRDGPYGEGMCQLWVGPPPSDEADGGDEADTAAEEPDALDAPPEQESAAPDAGPKVAAEPVDEADRADEADLLVLPGQHRLLALVDADEPGPGWKAVGLAQIGEGRTALLVHADHAVLRQLAILDAVINNADRKGRHLLHSEEGRLHAIDHGVTFHTQDKLRTLLWGWSGEPLPGEAVRTLRQLADDLTEDRPLATRLAQLITSAELEALRGRVAALLASGCHPLPGGDWPAIPWPPV